MPNYEVTIPRLRDRDIYRFFREVSETIGTTSFIIAEIGNHAITYNVAQDLSEPNPFIASSELFTVSNAGASVQGFSISLVRNTSEPFSDRLTINANDSGPRPDVDTTRAVNRLISESFERGIQPPIGTLGNQKAVVELVKSHQQMLVQLQSSATSITETIAEAHASLEQEFAKRSAQLDDDFQTRSSKIEEALETERKALREKEDALAQRNRDLDARDNTTARRAQHATLKSRIAERGDKFKITAETKRARWPIHVATVLSCAIILGFLAYYSTAIADLPPSSSLPMVIALAIKPIGLTVALLGLVAWYLRWMNRWFERHADTEFYLKQFELDIDRANWVVETALEWKEKQERTIPDGLLESISRNLFTKSEKDADADMHPADYLASAILGRASNVSLRVPGGEISLTGKDIKKLQKDSVE